jgi:UDP-glucose 4-epimerase
MDALKGHGFSPIALDQRPLLDGADLVADIRNPETYIKELSGVDGLVHLAGLHGRDHMQRFNEDEFWSVNVEGTRALYQAAVSVGITLTVLASSMAVYGPIPSAPGEWVTRDESSPTIVYDTYSLTKRVSEDIADYYAVRSGLRTTVLRFGHFAPVSPEHYGFRLLFGGVDVRDAASAIVAALVRPSESGSVRRLNIHARSILNERSTVELNTDAVRVVRALDTDLMHRVENSGNDIEDLMWGRSLWPIKLAEREIGYAPAWDFRRFSMSYGAGNESDFAPLRWPRWGI